MHVEGLISLGLFAAGLICFAGFTWAVKGHFRCIGPMPLGMRLIGFLSLEGFGWFALRLARFGGSSLWGAGIACFLLSIGLFIWAIRCTRETRPSLAFSTDEPTCLLREGPYRYVRHPFYVSYLLFWAGTAIATPGPIAWIMPALMLLIYTDAARREEAKFARSSLAAAYRQYRGKVGMFLPHLG